MTVIAFVLCEGIFVVDIFVSSGFFMLSVSLKESKYMKNVVNYFVGIEIFSMFLIFCMLSIYVFNISHCISCVCICIYVHFSCTWKCTLVSFYCADISEYLLGNVLASVLGLM